MSKKLLLIVCFLLLSCFLSFAEIKDIGAMKKGGKAAITGGALEILDIQNPDIIKSKYSQRFKYDSWDNPKLKELRTKYKLDEVIKGGKTEFEQMCLLEDWVFHAFKKFDHPTKETSNALEILKMVEDGGSAFCIQYGAVFNSCAYSLGWVTRIFGMKAIEPGLTEHTNAEIWSNQYRKWIVMDATHNYRLATAGAPGVYLSANEAREEYFKNKGKDVVVIAGKENQKYTFADLPAQRKGAAGYSGFNEKRTHQFALLLFTSDMRLLDNKVDYGNDNFMINDERTNGFKWHKREIPKDIKEIYWTLGDAKMQVSTGEKDKLEVSFTTETPNFDTFAVKLDESKEWQKSGNKYAWTLHKGKNKLTATAKNKFGVYGPDNFIELDYR